MKVKDKTNEVSKGEWVLLFNDEIVDHSANVEDILQLAEKKFPNGRYPKDSLKISKILSNKTPRETLLDK